MKNFDFQIRISTVNGSGSSTANEILLKCFVFSGIHAVGKNIFPSNIAGLPTWYLIRVTSQKYEGLKSQADLLISLCRETLEEDLKSLNGDCWVAKESPETPSFLNLDIKNQVKKLSVPVSLRKPLANMIYVGAVAKHFGLELSTCSHVIKKRFQGSKEIARLNLEAFELGYHEASEKFKLKADEFTSAPLLIDGNQASALGLLEAQCEFAFWYPITPSSSLVENFEKHVSDLKLSATIYQAEDEISAVGMTLGASWAGSRAMTATSGPGLSLMAETVGLAYFAEIPLVIFDIQRLGPSTGLPTRTSQGDLSFAHSLSHGDTLHPVLLPSNPEEAFQMAQFAFEISEDLRTAVFVLSDLDLGMNLKISHKEDFQNSKNKASKKNKLPALQPGTPLGGFMTRGSGHDPQGNYSESPQVYKEKVMGLKKKIMSYNLPSCIFKGDSKSSKLFIYYGSTKQIISELQDLIPDNVYFMEIKALPLSQKDINQLKLFTDVYCVEQNRDGQMAQILQSQVQVKITSLLQFDGWPIQADRVFKLYNEALL